jgi:hypothetical protein
MTQYSLTTFSTADIRETQPELKIGLLATVTEEGLPHVTMLSTLMAYSSSGLCFGQFTEGMSKQHILDHPQVGFLVMSLDRKMWRGNAAYTHHSKVGPEFDYYNNIPMFRYNAYFGVHTVYYLDLISHTGKSPLPMMRVVYAAVQTLLARTLGGKLARLNVINHWTSQFLNKLDNLKFLAYIAEDGFPQIIPAIQAQSFDAQHVIFSTSLYKDELERIPPGADLCVFGLSLDMEDVLLRGNFLGIQRKSGVQVGLVEINWVYNPMPPVPGQIYPPIPLEPVTRF